MSHQQYRTRSQTGPMPCTGAPFGCAYAVDQGRAAGVVDSKYKDRMSALRALNNHERKCKYAVRACMTENKPLIVYRWRHTDTGTGVQHEDGLRAAIMVNALLEKYGTAVMQDLYTLQPGDDLKKVAGFAIEHSSTAIVLLKPGMHSPCTGSHCQYRGSRLLRGR
eukprot:m51a1_g10603 hypothetical protein (165) ;mRNA; f:37619-38113